MTEMDDEVAQLRNRMIVEVDVPVGLTARLEVAVLRSARERVATNWETKAAIACVAFTLLHFIPDADGVLVSGVFAAGYAIIAGRRSFLSDMSSG